MSAHIRERIVDYFLMRRGGLDNVSNEYIDAILERVRGALEVEDLDSAVGALRLDELIGECCAAINLLDS
jgi:hypothetical protein